MLLIGAAWLIEFHIIPFSEWRFVIYFYNYCFQLLAVISMFPTKADHPFHHFILISSQRRPLCLALNKTGRRAWSAMTTHKTLPPKLAKLAAIQSATHMVHFKLQDTRHLNINVHGTTVVGVCLTAKLIHGLHGVFQACYTLYWSLLNPSQSSILDQCYSTINYNCVDYLQNL